MVRRTRRNGGMLGKIQKIAQPLGRATVILAEEYGKDWAQKKAPKAMKEIYNNPSSATDPKVILTGTKTLPSPKFDINSIDIEDSENVNPNIIKIKGGKTRRGKLKKRKSRKSRK